MKKFLTYIILAALAISAQQVFGQNDQIVGWYSPIRIKTDEPIHSGYKEPLNIPFKRVGNLILLEANIDGVIGYFILDTGAPYLVLNSTYFRDYPHIQDYAAFGINNVEVDIFRTRIQSLVLRDISYDRLEADVADLSHIENGRNTKILGLLGTNLFTDFVLGIDYENQVVSIQSPKDFAAMRAGLNLHEIPFVLKNSTISLAVSVNDIPLNFVFDTGAEMNVLDNALPDAVYESFIIQKRSSLKGSVGAPIEVYAGVLLAMKIGALPISSMKTLMTDLDGIGKVYDVKVDGILGYEFLAKGPMYVNFKTSELYIEKKKSHE